MHQAAELFSLAATVPAILSGCIVIALFGREAIKATAEEARDASQWLIMGITIGFIGSVLDNAYWAIPWTASYLRSPDKFWLVDLGVYFNCVFRQGCGIAAAYCHFRSALTFRDRSDGTRRVVAALMWSSILLGASYAVILFFAAQ
ncbi:hypothetical protein U8335_04050 [Roseiconus lacunae]|uniref:Uncharacterized protein n=1 Tax=Roseiconus lacunae TaxID=2605694 RepID=A0ABT7PI80_9BACT|nr:hypothetical protein [Roseiconus lacunae]MDM4015956.1 hypothetical protein [Roseiconus lacunae]WRQ51715.1 hypothetical protein U8335_04050 [Stieleria sp. HD01]